MSVVLGTLIIDLKANTASFSQDMNKMSSLSGKTANDVKRSLEKIAAAGIAMGLAVATGTAALIKSALNTADRLDELAQKAGTTTETLSALGYAAKFSSIDTEQLSGMLVKLSKAALGAQSGNMELRAAFKLLHVDVEQSKGVLKDSGVIFQELAPRMSLLAESAGKTALATKLLGKSGADSIPLLNQLGESAGALTKEAKQLGVVISTDTARGAGDANDNFDRLKTALDGLTNNTLAAALPALLKLSERLVQVAKDANIPDLGKAFGATVTTAIGHVGDALEFAVKHANALKIAIEALLALQVAKFAVPFLVEVFTSGSLTAGVLKFSTSLLGIGKILPVLNTFSVWAKVASSDMLFFAANEGIAATATYYFGGALAVLTAPITIAIAAIATLAGGMYYFRDSAFSAQGEVYKLKDAYTALWQILSFQNKGEGSWAGNLARVKKEREAAEKAAAAPPAALAAPAPPKARAKLNLDTGDLSPKQKDVYREEIAKLDLAIKAQRSYLAVVGASPEKIAAAASEERAAAIILEKNTALVDASRPKLSTRQEQTIRQMVATEDATKALVEYTRSIVGEQQSTDLSIQQQEALTAAVAGGEEATRRAGVQNELLGIVYGKTAVEIEAAQEGLKKLGVLLAKKADVEGLAAFTKSLDDQQRAITLSIQQTEALAAAELKGEGEVRSTIAANALLTLTFGKTIDETKTLQEQIDKLTASRKEQAAADRLDAANKQVASQRTDLGARAGLPAAILQGEDAYRKASLAAKTYAIDQQIATEQDDKVRAALVLERQGIVDLTKAELAEADARDALSLRSTADKYNEETAALNRQIDALTEGGKRALTYGESQQVAAKRQEILNHAIDEQVENLKRSGGAQDGITAFFLNMEKQAKSSAAIMYDALNSAFDKLSDNITDLLTGAKTNFAQAFKDIGRQIVNETVKSGLQKGIGALGKALGISPGDKPDGTEDNPLWVRMKDRDGNKEKAVATPEVLGVPLPPSTGGFANTLGHLLQKVGPLIGGLVGGASSGSASGSTESVSSSISYRASGGPVSPNMAYMVGEHGPEILSGASGVISNNAKTERMLGKGGGDHYYTIDARGTDPVLTEQRTRAAIMAAHNSAVTTGVQVQSERMKRMPQQR